MSTTAIPVAANPIGTALEQIIVSAPVQTALLDGVKSGEVALQTVVDTAINNLKGNGALGLVIAAGKGSVEAALNNEIASWPPEKVAAFLTHEALLGAAKL